MPLFPFDLNQRRASGATVALVIGSWAWCCCPAAADDQPDVIRFVAPESSPGEQADAESIPAGRADVSPTATPESPSETQRPERAAGEQVVKFVAPARLPRIRTDPRVQPALVEAKPASSAATVIPTARLQTDDGALPLPPVEQDGPPEVVNPLLDDPMPLTADVRPFQPITNLTVDISLPPGRAPGADLSPGATRPVGDARLVVGWATIDFTWVPTNMVHRPLYFEQVNLERYGYSVGPCLQPIVSGAHFFAVIPALPYKMAVQCPTECVYTLGHYRPGDCGVPRRWHRPGWRWSAAAVEVGTVAGLILLIP